MDVPKFLKEHPILRRLEGETPEFHSMLFASRRNPRLGLAYLAEQCGVQVIDILDYLVPAECVTRAHIFSDHDYADSTVRSCIVECLNDTLRDGAERSDALCQSIVDMLYVYNIDLSSHALLCMRVGYLYLDLFGKLEEWFKFQTTLISATLLKQSELPATPSWLTGRRVGVIGGGRLYREIRSLYNRLSVDAHVMSFAASILALKRGALPLRADLVAESLEKHRETLGREPAANPMLSQIIDSINEIDLALEPELKKKVPQWRLPSASSSFGWTRAVGGALGRITELAKEKFGVFSGQEKSLAGYTSGLNPMPIYVPTYMYDMYDLVLEEALKENLDCDVHVVLEPMKARIITSGPPARYHICRILQKMIHSVMRNRREFSLIGEPVTETLLNDNFRMLSSHQSSRWVVVSADYSAATDNINGLLCEAYVEGKVRSLGLEGDTAKVYRESMTNHVLHYPEEFGGFVQLQRTGQLMGSPTSFPGLCQINLATLHAAWKEYVSLRAIASPYCENDIHAPSYKEMLRTLRPLANGDDLLFVAPSDFIPVWRRWVDLAGLKPSPGKNYVSSHFAVINSTFFQLTRHDDTDVVGWNFQVHNGSALRFHRVHWVGSGLLKGQARVLSDTRNKPKNDSVDFGQLNSQLKWVLDWESGRSEEASRCMGIWFRNMRPILMEQDRSWRLPVLLGGLGLPVGSATRPQLVLANMIVKTQNWGLAQRMVPRSPTENPVTRIQLVFENEMRRLLGLKRVPMDARPWTVLKIDGEARVIEAKPVDVSIPAVLCGLPSLESEEMSVRGFVNFCDQMMSVVKGFNGGPMSLDDAILWNKPLCWIGAQVSLPNPCVMRFERRREEVRNRMLSCGNAESGWCEDSEDE